MRTEVVNSPVSNLPWNMATSSWVLGERIECIPNFNGFALDADEFCSENAGCFGTRNCWRGTNMSSIRKDDRFCGLREEEAPWK